MGYKLADGSDSDLYRVGDTFVVCAADDEHFQFASGSIVELTNNDGSELPFFCGPFPIRLGRLTPTEETKRKVAERNQHKCKCGYVIPVMEIAGGDLGKPWEDLDSAIDIPLRYLFGWDCEKPREDPDPLARVIDWRGGEEVKPLDFVISNEFGVDYRSVVLEVISPTQVRTCRGLIGASHGNLTIIRINTAAIPKKADHDQGRG